MGVGRRVVGEGPVPSTWMVIGEYPGKIESRTGRPFSGKTGDEIDRFFDGVRLPTRDEGFFTNWIREWCGEDGEYTAVDFARDEPDLTSEIRQVQPRIVIALGRNITRWFLGDVDLEDVHAFQWYLPVDSPRRSLFENPEQVIIHAGYNPAAAFRNPQLSTAVAYDFAQLEQFWEGKVQPRALFDDPYPDPLYRELKSIEEVDWALDRSAGISIATDTEGLPHAPWSVQISSQAGVAYIIRARRTDLIARFAARVNATPERFHFVFHSALHDLGMFRVYGIDVTRITFDDTQIMAYNLQIEPLGLKPLCVRFNNMPMQSFEEVMGDADYQKAQDWLLATLGAEDLEWEYRCQDEMQRLMTTPYTDKKGKVKPGRRLKVPPKLPKTDLHKALTRALRSAQPRKLWAKQTIDIQVEADHKYGPMWEATLDDVPTETAITYACRDADGTRRLAPQLMERIKAADLEPVYRADIGTVLLIDRMQQIGIRPDLAHFALLGEDLEFELVEIRTHLAELLETAGAFDIRTAFEFNPNSTYQVGDLLFKYFGLPVLKETEDGDASTNDKILEALEKMPDLPGVARQIISTIRLFRETYKLKHTFVDKIPDYVNRWPFDGRIHTTFRITRIPTGRLAASDPNLLAMPKYGKFAKPDKKHPERRTFREGFIAGDGHVLTSHDQSQIELRCLAHLSRDPVLLAAYRDGLDLHAKLSQRIFGGKEEDHKDGMTRLAAKAINFGIPMGMTEIGLSIELKKNGVDADEDTARRWLDETMGLYARVPVYQQEKQAEARRKGYTTDIKGRRFYLGGIRSTDRATRAEAERQAGALPIQSSAQEVMKEAEAYVWEHVILKRQRVGQWIEPLVQIHDDLLVECEEKIAQAVHEDMVIGMTQAPAHLLCVPLATSGDYGENWGHMQGFEKKAA